MQSLFKWKKSIGKAVLAARLSPCTKQRVDIAQKMGDKELITQQINCLVLICEAKTWSLKKKGNAVSVLSILATGLS